MLEAAQDHVHRHADTLEQRAEVQHQPVDALRNPGIERHPGFVERIEQAEVLRLRRAPLSQSAPDAAASWAAGGGALDQASPALAVASFAGAAPASTGAVAQDLGFAWYHSLAEPSLSNACSSMALEMMPR